MDTAANLKQDSPPDFPVLLEAFRMKFQEALRETLKNMRTALVNQAKVHLNRGCSLSSSTQTVALGKLMKRVNAITDTHMAVTQNRPEEWQWSWPWDAQFLEHAIGPNAISV